MCVSYLRVFHSWRVIWQNLARSLKNIHVQFYPEVGIYSKETISGQKCTYKVTYCSTVYKNYYWIDTVTRKNLNEQREIGDINLVIKWKT